MLTINKKTSIKLKLAFFGILLVLIITAIILGSAKPRNEKPASFVTTPPYNVKLDKNIFQLLSKMPEEDEITAINNVYTVKLVFSKPIDITNMSIDSQPHLEFHTTVLTSNPEELLLKPKKFWEYGKNYELSISGIESTFGETLNQEPLKIKFKINKGSFVNDTDFPGGI